MLPKKESGPLGVMADIDPVRSARARNELDRSLALDGVEFGQSHLVTIRGEDRVVRARFEEKRGAARGCPACRIQNEEWNVDDLRVPDRGSFGTPKPCFRR